MRPQKRKSKQPQKRRPKQPLVVKKAAPASLAPPEKSKKQEVPVPSENGESIYDSLQPYMREIGRTKLLSRAEERKLARKVRAGDDQAREQMILANLRLVVHIARGFEHMGVPLNDLINEGNIGLMKAVERYNPRKAKLSTYAAWWIKQQIKRALANQAKTVRLPVHVVDIVLKLRRIAIAMQENLGRDPTPEELEAETGIPASRISLLLEAATTPASLDTPFGENESMMGEVIRDENAISPAEATEAKANARIIRQLMAELPERERVIIECRYGFDGGDAQTLEAVGRRFGITRERIRQIQKQLLEQLRRSIERLDDRERNEIMREFDSSTVRAEPRSD